MRRNPLPPLSNPDSQPLLDTFGGQNGFHAKSTSALEDVGNTRSLNPYRKRYKYPLYEHSKATKDMPKKFYNQDSEAFQEYKAFEQRIFNNRDKLV